MRKIEDDVQMTVFTFESTTTSLTDDSEYGKQRSGYHSGNAEG